MNILYECKYVKVELRSGAFERKPIEDYHKIIDEHLLDGWRFVQAFSPNTLTGLSSTASYLELIFEREVRIPNE